MQSRNPTESFHGGQRENKETYPPGSYVEIMKVGDAGKRELHLKCTLKDDGTVVLIGDAELVRELEKGFEAPVFPGFKFVTPQEGVVFLIGLGSRFQSPYLFATEIKVPDSQSKEVEK